jgi:Kef-type K+ transport system membrane component KefB
VSVSQHSADWIANTSVGDVAVILIAGSLFVLLARRLRQPAVIGEIAAGLALGPSLLGLFPGHLPNRLFPAEVRGDLSVVAQVGLLLFMFIIGWEFDSSAMQGRKSAAGLIWAVGRVAALGCGMGLAVALYGSHRSVGGHHVRELDFVLYLGVAMSITAFPVLARIIADRRMQTTRMGTLALTLAAADDALAWCMLAVVVALTTSGGAGGFLSTIGWALVFSAGMVWVVRPLLAALFRRLGEAAAPYAAMCTAAGVYLASYATARIGIHAIFGAFLFGMVMPRRMSSTLARAVHEPLKHASNLLLPVFFVVTGLSVDLTTLGARGLWELLAIIVVACAGKIGGIALPARATGMSWENAATLGLLMNTRGLTELIILTVGLNLGLLSVSLFSSMVVMALVTTAMAAPLLSLLVRRGRADQDGWFTEGGQDLLGAGQDGRDDRDDRDDRAGGRKVAA